MCGICLVVRGVLIVPPWVGPQFAPCRHHIHRPHLHQQVLRRGPDGASSFQHCIPNIHCGGAGNNKKSTTAGTPPTIEYLGALLSLRGQPTFQPLVENTDGQRRSVLLWNGEVFGGQAVPVAPGESDTRAVFESLLQLEHQAATAAEDERDERSSFNPSRAVAFFVSRCRDLLEGIEGPYGMAYYAASFQVLVFGRDPLGRRSLVLHCNQSETILSSVAGAHEGEKLGNAARTSCLYDDLMPLAAASSAIKEEEDAVPARKAPRLENRDSIAANDDDDASGGSCWLDVPTGGLFFVDFGETLVLDERGRLVSAAVMVPWADHERGAIHPLLSARSSSSDSMAVPEEDWALVQGHFASVGYVLNPDIDSSCAAATRYLAALTRSVEKRVVATSRNSTSPLEPVAVLFSGGIDSTVLAALTHYVLPDIRTPIELINVAFGDDVAETPDRIASVKALAELRGNLIRGADREWRFVTVDVPTETVAERRSTILDLVFPSATVMDHNIGSAIFFAAQGVGLLHQGGNKSDLCENAALPGHKHFRVAAAAPSTLSATSGTTTTSTQEKKNKTGGSEEVRGEGKGDGEDGDDETGYKTLVQILTAEYVSGCDAVPLSTLGKEYRDVLAPVWQARGHKKLGHYICDASRDGFVKWSGGATSKSVSLCREEDVQRAMERRAKRAEMLSETIAGAVPYRCSSKVLILGMGADETLGGYVRYQRVFQHSGMQMVEQEMQRDFSRLWVRNLGRDDRCVSDSGREGRFPFLDEDVLRVLREVPLFSDVCDVASLRPGIGDKKLLRTCARMVGLRDVSRLQKRAIQFGSRIADRRQQGSSKIPSCAAADDE